MPDTALTSEFGALLRHWRRARGLSQLELAALAGVSTRHLSFLETGRCGPSRAAVQQLGRALELPEPEIERLLLVAGFAGDWTRGAADREPIRRQLARLEPLLRAHDPFPAFICDPEWRIGWQNRGARAWFGHIVRQRPDLGVDPLDLRALLASRGCFGPIIEDWKDLLAGVRAGLYQLEPDPGSSCYTRPLLEVLPRGERAGDAIERAARTPVWQQRIRIVDGGAAFPLELCSLPFAGGASGFALVLAEPADPESAPRARAYFARLEAGLPAG